MKQCIYLVKFSIIETVLLQSSIDKADKMVTRGVQ